MRKPEWRFFLLVVAPLIALAVLLPGPAGCGSSQPTLPPATPGGGFIIETLKDYGGPPVTVPFVKLQVAWNGDLTGAAGDPTTIYPPPNGPAQTNNLGLYAAVGKRAPAVWNFTWFDSSPDDSNVCNGQTISLNAFLNEITQLYCNIYTVIINGNTASFQMSPQPIYIGSPPSSATITGSGLSTTYGMPLVQYYNMDGTFVSQENATSVASNGTSMQISGFDISQLPSGAYAGFVSNAASGGGYTYLGTGGVVVANGGVLIDGDEQSTQVCHRWATGGDCLQWVTVYDHGTVSITINGVASSVSYGENDTPTTIAVALYNAINGNANLNSIVTAIVSGTTVLLNVHQPGSQYSLSAVATSGDTRDFPDGSFSALASGSTF